MRTATKYSLVIILAGLTTIILILWIWPGGGISREEATGIADKVITEKYPWMIGSNISVDNYFINDKEFYEITYKKTELVKTENRTVKITDIVKVMVNKDNGETIVIVSG